MPPNFNGSTVQAQQSADVEVIRTNDKLPNPFEPMEESSSLNRELDALKALPCFLTNASGWLQWVCAPTDQASCSLFVGDPATSNVCRLCGMSLKQGSSWQLHSEGNHHQRTFSLLQRLKQLYAEKPVTFTLVLEKVRRAQFSDTATLKQKRTFFNQFVTQVMQANDPAKEVTPAFDRAANRFDILTHDLPVDGSEELGKDREQNQDNIGSSEDTADCEDLRQLGASSEARHGGNNKRDELVPVVSLVVQEEKGGSVELCLSQEDADFDHQTSPVHHTGKVFDVVAHEEVAELVAQVQQEDPDGSIRLGSSRDEYLVHQTGPVHHTGEVFDVVTEQGGSIELCLSPDDDLVHQTSPVHHSGKVFDVVSHEARQQGTKPLSPRDGEDGLNKAAPPSIVIVDPIESSSVSPIRVKEASFAYEQQPEMGYECEILDIPTLEDTSVGGIAQGGGGSSDCASQPSANILQEESSEAPSSEPQLQTLHSDDSGTAPLPEGASTENDSEMQCSNEQTAEVDDIESANKDIQADTRLETPVLQSQQLQTSEDSETDSGQRNTANDSSEIQTTANEAQTQTLEVNQAGLGTPNAPNKQEHQQASQNDSGTNDEKKEEDQEVKQDENDKKSKNENEQTELKTSFPHRPSNLGTIAEDWHSLGDTTEKAESCIAALAFVDIY